MGPTVRCSASPVPVSEPPASHSLKCRGVRIRHVPVRRLHLTDSPLRASRRRQVSDVCQRSNLGVVTVPSPPPGWYPDPYMAGGVRWFDGSVWTTHAVSSDAANPTATVQERFDPRSPKEMPIRVGGHLRQLGHRPCSPQRGSLWRGWGLAGIGRKPRSSIGFPNIRQPAASSASFSPSSSLWSLPFWLGEIVSTGCCSSCAVASHLSPLGSLRCAAAKATTLGSGWQGRQRLVVGFCYALASSPTTVGSVRLSPGLRYRTGPPRTVRRLALSVSARVDRNSTYGQISGSN